jgi:hypothetical protein
MFDKLKKLAVAREADTTKSSFAERFAFFRHEEKRRKCVAKLKECVEDLRTLTNLVTVRPGTDANNAAKRFKRKGYGNNMGNPPSMQLRSLLVNLYSVFQERYHCACTEGHEVKVCLKDTYDDDDSHPSLKIDFLLSGNFSRSSPQDIRWQEGNVMVSSQR